MLVEQSSYYGLIHETIEDQFMKPLHIALPSQMWVLISKYIVATRSLAHILSTHLWTKGATC